MDKIRYIDIKENILSDNRDLAGEIREQLNKKQVYMMNIMSSPGAGKTSFITETLRRIKNAYRTAVIEGDIESQVDAEKIASEGVDTVQLRTGGPCHLDAPMIKSALDTLDTDALDLIIIENVGNLVCPAEFDTGSALKVMILSVPEGDDKVLKYPLMFSVCDVLIINKIDYLESSDFNMDTIRKHINRLNPGMQIFEVSCKTGEGIDDWCNWLRGEINQTPVD